MSYGNNRTIRKSFRTSEKTAEIIPDLCRTVGANSSSQITEVAIVVLAIVVGKMTPDKVPLSIKPIVDYIQNNFLVKKINESVQEDYITNRQTERQLREIEKICYITRDMVMNMLPSVITMSDEQLASMPDIFKSADPRIEDEKHYFAQRSEKNFKECIRRNQMSNLTSFK